MLVPELENMALSKITSGDSVNYSRLHDSLCKCGKEMLAKYEKKQETSDKLTLKILAVKLLLSKLGDAPENPRETISAALKSHAETLQGYEHLLSTKGNNYVLMEKTQGLSEDNDHMSASFLRYHKLKNKLLESDSPLNDEQRAVISELAEKKGLTLGILETLETHPQATTKLLIRLHKAGLLKPELCIVVFEHQHPSGAVAALVSLHKENLVESGLNARVLEYKKPDIAARTVVILNKAGLFKPDFCAKVLQFKEHEDLARELVKINKSAMAIVGHSHSETEKVELLYSFLAKKMAEGIRAFCIALQREHTDIIACFIKKSGLTVLSLPLPEEQKAELLYRLLTCKDARGIPIFHVALQNGNPCAVNVFIQASFSAIVSLHLPTVRQGELLRDLLASKTADGTPGFYMALQKDCPDVIRSFVLESVPAINILPLSEIQKTELICELLACKRGDGIPGLHMAFQNGYAEAINEFILSSATAFKIFHLPNAEKVKLMFELLASKRMDGVPGFHITLYQGHSIAVRTFIRASVTVLIQFKLLDKQGIKWLYELLVSKGPDGIPGFYMALQKGHSDAIKTFIVESSEAVANFSLAEEEKAEWLRELLASKEANGTPGFHIALQKGHSDAIKTFIQESAAMIGKFPLTGREKTELLRELLASKKANGTPGFFMTLKDGYPDAITTFIQESAAAIVALPIPKERKAKLLCELLASKKTNGMPGFFMTLQKGHIDAIAAFFQASEAAMTRLSESEEEKAELLYSLFDSIESANKPKFLLTLKQSGPAVSKAFTEGIDQLPLSVRQKETLKHVTPDSVENTVGFNQ